MPEATKRSDRIHAALDGHLSPADRDEPSTLVRAERLAEIRGRALRGNRIVQLREEGNLGLRLGLPVVVAASVDYGTHREPVRPAYIDLRPEVHGAWSPDAHGVGGTGVLRYGDVILEVGTR